ncbi:uncharacterized protein LOC124380293 [Silurus meridionalis]|nr:uncharacterized protein LOC124380293 [Silurus meridionalis]
MPRHNKKACMPSRNNMRINKGFRGNMHHTRTHHNPVNRRSFPHTTRSHHSSGNLNHATRTHPKSVFNTFAQGFRGNIIHKKRTNPNPEISNHSTRTHPTSAVKGNIRHKKKTNFNKGAKGTVHHKKKTNSNSGNVGKRQQTKTQAGRRRNPDAGHRQMANKKKIIIQTGKSLKPGDRKSMSVLEKLKQKLKANRELTVRPIVQKTVLELLKQKLKSNRTLTVRPKAQSIISPTVTVQPVSVSGTTIHNPTNTRAYSYQPQYRAHHDQGNMKPHYSQQVSRISAVSAQGHRTDSSGVYHENIAEITDENLLFLKTQRPELIDKIKNVVGILDHLELSREKEAIVRAETTDQARMRKLLDFTTSTHAAKRLLQVLWKQAGDVMEDLEDYTEADDEDEVVNEAWNDAGMMRLRMRLRMMLRMRLRHEIMQGIILRRFLRITWGNDCANIKKLKEKKISIKF